MLRFKHNPELKELNFLKPETSDIKEKLVIIDIERASTATQTVASFFKVVGTANKNPDDMKVLKCTGVGLRCDGRSSLYELWYFTKSKNLYAVDLKDESYICEVKGVGQS
jgi:hypothetical protein